MRNVEQDRRSAAETEIQQAYQGPLDKYDDARRKRYRYPLTEELTLSMQGLYTTLAGVADRKIEWLRTEWQQQHGLLTGPDRRRGYGDQIEPKDAAEEACRLSSSSAWKLKNLWRWYT